MKEKVNLEIKFDAKPFGVWEIGIAGNREAVGIFDKNGIEPIIVLNAAQFPPETIYNLLEFAQTV